MLQRISVLFLVFLTTSCSTSKLLTLQAPPRAAVPYVLDTKSWSGQLGGRWFVNGKEEVPNNRGEIYLYQSGKQNVEYRYYDKGEVQVAKTILVLDPPIDFCQIAIKTSKGVMIAELNRDLAPQHSDYFEQLIFESYYDSLVFHRIVPGFVVQGGNGEETPFQRSSKSIMSEEIEAEFHGDLLHYKGALAMARMPDQVNPEKRSSPDQFYIVQGTKYDEERWEQYLTDSGGEYKSYQKEEYLKSGGSPQLDFEYSVFGRVILGVDVIDSLALVPTRNEKPVDPEWMIISKVE